MSRRRQKSYRNNSDKYNDRRKRSPKREVAKGVMHNRNQRQKIEEKRERQNNTHVAPDTRQYYLGDTFHLSVIVTIKINLLEIKWLNAKV